jgi:hypothetical protein
VRGVQVFKFFDAVLSAFYQQEWNKYCNLVRHKGIAHSGETLRAMAVLMSVVAS